MSETEQRLEAAERGLQEANGVLTLLELAVDSPLREAISDECLDGHGPAAPVATRLKRWRRQYQRYTKAAKAATKESHR